MTYQLIKLEGGGDRSSDFAEFDQPDDPIWLGDKMLIRHAVSISGKIGSLTRTRIQQTVKMLDRYCEERGLERIGKLETESWDWGNRNGIGTCCKIVDISLFVESIKSCGRNEEYDRIRRLPWWRRLFMPIEREG